MDFGSLPFMIWFLPVFLCVYYAMRTDRARKIVLVVGTLLFYGVSCSAWLPHLIGMTFLALLACGWVMRKGKVALWISCMVFIVVLIWNKMSETLMPGISFVIFTIVSLLIDTYRRRIGKVGFWDRVSYILCFPKLLSGPIARMEEMQNRKIYLMGERQIKTGSQIESGVACFIIGLGYKVLISNQLVGLWNEIQTIGFVSVSTPLAWLGILGYSLQLYFDFQGYSLMAIGIGKMLGFTFPDNFDSPYLSKSISEFYRRWHITLGRWFRDYVYIPLGGSRKGMLFTICNLFVVWLLTGLWHGFGWNFVLWGMFLFFWIALEKLFLKRFLECIPALGHIYIVILIPLSWVFFALPDLGDIQMCFLRLFAPLVHHEGIRVAAGDYIKYGSMYGPFLLAGIFFAFPYGEQWLKRNYRRPWGVLILLFIFWFSVYQISIGLNNPFMYFSF